MAKLFLVSIDLNQNELLNPRAHQLASAPGTPVSGQWYYNTTTNKMLYWNGTSWIDTSGGVTSVLGTAPIVVNTVGTVATVSIVAATTSVPGSMSAADKTKLDAATALGAVSTLVLRDGSGNFAANAVTGLATPSSGSHAANKDYVDSIAVGIDAKASAKCATTANITLSGTQTIDGFAALAGDRVLVKNQSTGSQNGIYVVAAGAWSRATDMAAASGAAAVYVWIEGGSTQADSGWLCTNNTGSDVVGTDNLVWVQFSGAGQITAGAGMTKTANTLDIVATDSSILVGTDSIGVQINGTTLEISSGLKVRAAGITHVEISSSAHDTTLIGGSGAVLSVAGYTFVASTTVGRKYVQTAASIGTTPGVLTVTHNLNSRAVVVSVRDTTTNEFYFCDVVAATVNTVTVTAIGSTKTVDVTVLG